jgi:hypothetical protein
VGRSFQLFQRVDVQFLMQPRCLHRPNARHGAQQILHAGGAAQMLQERKAAVDQQRADGDRQVVADARQLAQPGGSFAVIEIGQRQVQL